MLYIYNALNLHQSRRDVPRDTYTEVSLNWCRVTYKSKYCTQQMQVQVHVQHLLYLNTQSTQVLEPLPDHIQYLPM